MERSVSYTARTGVDGAGQPVVPGGGQAAGAGFVQGGVGGDDHAGGFNQGDDGFAFFEFEIFAAVAGNGGGQF